LEIQGLKILVKDIFSGYKEEDLLDLRSDPYLDKKIHQKFLEDF
tara:strand:+ start:26870 stop:27001 length:132 start_codon:yes stop_codon:yes gene_type:complete